MVAVIHFHFCGNLYKTDSWKILIFFTNLSSLLSFSHFKHGNYILSLTTLMEFWCFLNFALSQQRNGILHIKMLNMYIFVRRMECNLQQLFNLQELDEISRTVSQLTIIMTTRQPSNRWLTAVSHIYHTVRSFIAWKLWLEDWLRSAKWGKLHNRLTFLPTLFPWE